MTRPSRILVVTTTFPRKLEDNQPRFVLDLCKSISNEYEQLVLAPSAPDCGTESRIEGIAVHRARYFFRRGETLAYGSGILTNLRDKPMRWLLLPFFLMGLVLAIRKELRQFRPDIVHAHWWLPAGLAARLAIATSSSNCKLLITCHGTDYYTLGERYARLRDWVFKRTDTVAMVSAAMRDHAIQHELPGKNLHVAPMGVNLRDVFIPDATTNRRGVLYVGRLVETKGVDDLLTAWTDASTATHAQGLKIIGSGSQLAALQSKARALGVSESVQFLGAVTHQELAPYYQQAALLVFPSIGQEGLGLAAIEAMGCGCPVLASEVRSLADVITDGKTGFTYAMGDTAALAQRLDELVSSPERCSEVAELGRELATSRFDWSVVGANYESLYGDLINR